MVKDDPASFGDPVIEQFIELKGDLVAPAVTPPSVALTRAVARMRSHFLLRNRHYRPLQYHHCRMRHGMLVHARASHQA